MTRPDATPTLPLTSDATIPTLVGCATPRAGSRVGRYRILERLGVGAMGSVFRAWDPQLHRDVALKVLHGSDEHPALHAARMRHEARALALLSHPNVVRVFTVERGAGDSCSIAMELVEGSTLAQWLRKPRHWTDVLAVMCAAGRGLQAAHAAGLVHRDFKPSNVLVGLDPHDDTKVGRVCVSDFGLVASVRARVGVTCTDVATGTGLFDDGETLGSSRVMVGTPAYMAPEQHEGRAPDPRSDQFSFCVALWEGLFGLRPFAANSSFSLAEAKRTGAIQRPPTGANVPRRLVRVLARGLAPRAEDRWPDMTALMAALQRRPARARWSAAAGLALALLGVGAGGAATLAPCAATAVSSSATQLDRAAPVPRVARTSAYR